MSPPREGDLDSLALWWRDRTRIVVAAIFRAPFTSLESPMALNDQRWQALCACIVAELDDVPEDAIKPETLLVEDLEIDSLLAANLAFELEDAFDILIEEAEMRDVTTVGDLAQLIDSKTES